jgi:hypothetical protein
MAKKRKPNVERTPVNPRNIDRHKQPRLAFHLPQDLYDAFERYVDSLRPKPAEATVLRLAIEELLTQVGFWPPTPGEGTGPS